MEQKQEVVQTARRAKAAASILANLPRTDKDRFLLALAEELARRIPELINENKQDIAAAEAAGLPPAMIARLSLNAAKIHQMAAGLRDVAALPDPVGGISSMWQRPNGLTVGRMRIPLGVIAIIYESRPNVTIDAAALCLKSGNAAILRGGSEAIRSNIALGDLIRQVLAACGLPADAVQVVRETNRQVVSELLQQEEYIDLVIPRGGEELIRAVVRESKIPIIKHYKGVCHIYVDARVNRDMALAICINAKVQRPEVCNALETLLVHQAVAADFLPPLARKMTAAGVVLRGCALTRQILPEAEEATEDDWHREYLDLTLSVKVVADMEAAIRHIENYGSQHTEAILTDDYENSRRFLKEVNSSTVLVNASTRFSDGFELGLGAEIGISTTKLHAFGPMGLEELTTQKFIIYGDGQVRT